MFVVYVLKSEKDGNLYIGCTSDLEKRLKMHQNGKIFSTKSRLPVHVIFTEGFTNKYEAYNKERYYKTASGKRDLKNKMALSSNG